MQTKPSKTRESPVKARFTPTPQQRIDVTRFVGYELWMLRECADMPKPRTQSEKNVWYEGLVLHARILRDFFFTKVDDDGKRISKSGDIVAVDYFKLGTASWPYTSANLSTYLKDNKDRMDWTLAHLTFWRLDFTGSQKEWSAECLRNEIGAKWVEFIEKLQTLNEPSAAAFIREATKRKVPLIPPF
jgi:hypothetical protein